MSRPRPNQELLEILSKPSLGDLAEQVNAFDIEKNELGSKNSKNISGEWLHAQISQKRQIYMQYISDMLPFYFNLLITYLICLGQQAEYTVEDIEAFR